MKFKTLISSMVLGFGAMAAASAGAATITNADGTFTFTGFDWAQGGTAVVTGFNGTTNSPFTLNYFANATTIQNGQQPLNTPGLDNYANGTKDAGRTYEYTVVASLNEQATNCTKTGTGSSASNTCTFQVLSGTYSIYYDTAANANTLAGSKGTGFTDGTLILSGTFAPQNSGQFTSDSTGANGTGSTSLIGTNTFTNAAFVKPLLTDSTIGTTLQLGDKFTNYTSPGGFDGVAFTNGQIVFQADANQSFTTTTTNVPEPASLALLAVGLLAGGLTLRRKA